MESLTKNDEENSISLYELLEIIWSGKAWIFSIVSLFTIVAIIVSLSLQNQYRSSVILAPSSSTNGTGLSMLAGQFGGLASLAGINLGSGGEDKAQIAIEILQTWGFLESFIEDNQIQVDLFAADGWSRVTNKLTYDDSLYDIETQQWVREFDPSKGETSAPNSWELYEELRERMSIKRDKTTGFVTLAIEYYSPELAAEWLSKLVIAINTHMQEMDKNEALNSISYLNEKIKETNNIDMQSVFYKLIEEQTKTLMLAEVSKEYVFKTLSKVKPAQKKSKPYRVLIVAVGSLIGFLCALLVIFIRRKV